MGLSIAIPLIISQFYIEKASYRLISIDKVEEMKGFENEKYFHFNSFEINREAGTTYITSRISGRYNQDLIFYFFRAYPFKNSKDVWYGTRITEKIDNRISNKKKDSKINDFIKKSRKYLETYDFHNVEYFEKLGYSDDRDGFREAIASGKSKIDKTQQIILIPHDEPFENRLGKSFFWFFCSYGIGAFIVLLLIIIREVDKTHLNNLKKDKLIIDDDLSFVLIFLNPMGPFRGTAILLLLNIAVYGIMVLSGLNFFSPTSKELLEIGAIRRNEVLHGDYWRLITYIFIHGSVTHLFMNLIALGFGAGFLEGKIGHLKLILSFLITGICAGLSSILWHKSTIAVGASGAIFGLFGMILSFTIFKIYSKDVRGLAWILLALIPGTGLLFGFLGGIDNASHFGGLVSGFVIGVILILFEKEKLSEKN